MNSSDQPENEPTARTARDNLSRGFGLSTATFVVVASMVGTGILVSPGYMMLSLENHIASLVLWLLGGALALCGAMCVAELATLFPQAGGEYVYIREAYGPMPAFLAGWSSLFLGFAAPLAVAAYIAAAYIVAPLLPGAEVGDPGWTVRLVAVGIIVATTIPNILGHRHSALAQNTTTVIKIALFAVLVVAAIISGRLEPQWLAQGRPVADISWPVAATQLFYVMFAYSGWNAAGYLAGEVREPTRVLPRALLLGTGLVTALYLALAVVFACTVPRSAVTWENAERVPMLSVGYLFGDRAAAVFSVAVGVTFLATVNALVVTGPRVYFAMARDGLFPAAAGRVSPRFGVPANATIAQSACALLVLLAFDFQSLYRYAAVGLSIFSLLFIAAVYVLRRSHPDAPRPFRVPGYPIVPAVFLGVTLFMAAFALKEWPGPSLLSMGSILAGIPVYYAWRWLARRRHRGPRRKP